MLLPSARLRSFVTSHLSRCRLFRCVAQGLATFTSFLDVLERCVKQYSSAVVSACGVAGSVIPRGDESYKLKQSGEETEPSLLHRHAALLQKNNIKLQAVNNAARSAVEKAIVEMVNSQATTDSNLHDTRSILSLRHMLCVV